MHFWIMIGFHLNIAGRKKVDKHCLSWFPKAPCYDHPSSSLVTLWEIVMVGPILCAGTSAMHRLYVLISFIICSCFVTLQVCNRGYDLLWCACRQSNWWLKERQWTEKHYTLWHWRSLGSNLKRMIIQISSCHLHWRDFAIALLTSWVGMRVIINLRISPLLTEVSKRTIVGTNWRKYFFPQRSWERAKWTAQRSRSKAFVAKRVKGAVNNLYMKVLHIGRLFEWDFLHVSTPLSTLLAFV